MIKTGISCPIEALLFLGRPKQERGIRIAAKDYTRSCGRVQIQLIAIHIRHLDPPRLGNHGLDGRFQYVQPNSSSPGMTYSTSAQTLDYSHLATSRHTPKHLECLTTLHHTPSLTQRAQANIRTDATFSHTTASNTIPTPRVHRTQLCGITTTISKVRAKNNQKHQKNESSRHNRHRGGILSPLPLASEQSSRTPCSLSCFS